MVVDAYGRDQMVVQNIDVLCNIFTRTVGNANIEGCDRINVISRSRAFGEEPADHRLAG